MRPWKEEAGQGWFETAAALQWGHDLAAVKGALRRTSLPAGRRLQWGHDLAAVEGCRWAYGWRRRGVASMGPRPCGRGRRGRVGAFGDMAAGFNGATTLRPWKARARRALRCGRRCFNGATTLRPWKGLQGLGKRLDRLGFNGATTLRPWKACRPARPSRARHGLQWGHDLAAVEGGAVAQHRRRGGGASMGPRPCGRGRSLKRRTHAPCSPLQWGHDLAAVEGLAAAARIKSPLGFNGATTLRPWKELRLIDRYHDTIQLQWGHDLAAVEGSAWCLPSLRSPGASMGPRPCGRGRLRARAAPSLTGR